ncbi:MAG: hypothetical protein AB1810_05400 [Pseudomonadota bacterium]
MLRRIPVWLGIVLVISVTAESALAAANILSHEPTLTDSGRLTYNLSMDKAEAIDEFNQLGVLDRTYQHRITAEKKSCSETPLEMELPPYVEKESQFFVYESTTRRIIPAHRYTTHWKRRGDKAPGTVSLSATACGNYHVFRYFAFPADLNDAQGQPVAASTTRLVVLIHDWNSAGLPDMYGEDERRQPTRLGLLKQGISNQLAAINQKLGTDWTLVPYHWERDAVAGYQVLTDEGLDWARANQAAEIAYQHGYHLGQLLAAKMPSLQKVQFIAQGAGAWVARSAAEHLVRNSKAVVQLTLLNPFLPRENAFKDDIAKARLGAAELQNWTLAQQARIEKLEHYFTETDARYTSQGVWWLGQEAGASFEVLNRRADYPGSGGAVRFPGYQGAGHWYYETTLDPEQEPLAKEGLWESAQMPFYPDQAHGWYQSLPYCEWLRICSSGAARGKAEHKTRLRLLARLDSYSGTYAARQNGTLWAEVYDARTKRPVAADVSYVICHDEACQDVLGAEQKLSYDAASGAYLPATFQVGEVAGGKRLVLKAKAKGASAEKILHFTVGSPTKGHDLSLVSFGLSAAEAEVGDKVAVTNVTVANAGRHDEIASLKFMVSGPNGYAYPRHGMTELKLGPVKAGETQIFATGINGEMPAWIVPQGIPLHKEYTVSLMISSELGDDRMQDNEARSVVRVGKEDLSEYNAIVGVVADLRINYLHNQMRPETYVEYEGSKASYTIEIDDVKHDGCTLEVERDRRNLWEGKLQYGVVHMIGKELAVQCRAGVVDKSASMGMFSKLTLVVGEVISDKRMGVSPDERKTILNTPVGYFANTDANHGKPVEWLGLLDTSQCRPDYCRFSSQYPPEGIHLERKSASGAGYEFEISSRASGKHRFAVELKTELPWDAQKDTPRLILRKADLSSRVREYGYYWLFGGLDVRSVSKSAQAN